MIRTVLPLLGGAALVSSGALAVMFIMILLLAMLSGVPQDQTRAQDEDGAAPSSSGRLNTDAVPAEYVDLIVAAGQQCEGIESPFIAAMLESESNFNPDAVSPVGAEGIAQFMPGTWALYGEGGDPFNPDDAIPAQARFLCDLHAQAQSAVDSGQATGAVLDLVMAGYNAGFGRVIEYGGIPPFTETQNYVEKINRLIEKYTATEAAPEAADGEFVHPAPGAPQTSPYGMRTHPITGQQKMHTGQDYGVACGDPIVAFGAGEVSFSGWQGGYGNRIEVDHGGGMVSTYSHNSELTVAVGDTVTPGQEIAKAGTTGSSTGCHLHFEIQINGDYVDPKEYLP